MTNEQEIAELKMKLQKLEERLLDLQISLKTMYHDLGSVVQEIRKDIN